MRAERPHCTVGRLSRFTKALLLALALHGGFVATRWLGAEAQPVRPIADATELVVELEPATALAAPVSTPAPLPEANEAVAALAPAVAARRAAEGRVEEPQSAASVEAASVEAASEGSEPVAALEAAPATSATAPRKIDLGLDGRMFLLPQNLAMNERDGVPAKPRVRKEEIERRLDTYLSAEKPGGMPRGGALIGSLNAATRAAGPTRGEALIRVTLDAHGNLDQVELLRGTASDWSAALVSFREQAKTKRVRLPSGARGLRVTLAVRSKVQRPSGKEVESSAVGVKTPSVTEPDGLTLRGDFDLADLSGGAQRMVHSRVIAEEVL